MSVLQTSIPPFWRQWGETRRSWHPLKSESISEKLRFCVVLLCLSYYHVSVDAKINVYTISIHVHYLHTRTLSSSRLGLLSDTPAPLSGTPLDTLCAHLQENMQYRDGERDAVFLRETFTIEWPNKTQVGNYHLRRHV